MTERKLLRVEYDDGHYFIEEKALNEHIETNLDSLRQHVLTTTDISNKKFAIVVVLVTGVVGIIASLAVTGAHFWAFIIALIALADVKPILSFLEKNPK